MCVTLTKTGCRQPSMSISYSVGVARMTEPNKPASGPRVTWTEDGAVRWGCTGSLGMSARSTVSRVSSRRRGYKAQRSSMYSSGESGATNRYPGHRGSWTVVRDLVCLLLRRLVTRTGDSARSPKNSAAALIADVPPLSTYMYSDKVLSPRITPLKDDLIFSRF